MDTDIRFREIQSDSMSDDLRIIYRSKFAPRSLIGGITVLVGTIVMLIAFMCDKSGIEFNDIHIFGEFVLINLISWSASFIQLSGLPVRRFERKNSEELPMIERSYMTGRMLLYKVSGLNIGDDYIVFINSIKCSCVRLSDIREVIAYRDPQWRNFKDKPKKRAYIIAICINGQKPILINVDRYESEYLCDELMRRRVNIVKENYEKEKYI